LYLRTGGIPHLNVTPIRPQWPFRGAFLELFRVWVWVAEGPAPLPNRSNPLDGGRRRKTAYWPSGRNGTGRSSSVPPGRRGFRKGPESRISPRCGSGRCSGGILMGNDGMLARVSVSSRCRCLRRRCGKAEGGATLKPVLEGFAQECDGYLFDTISQCR
jgi:hypothetical protein